MIGILVSERWGAVMPRIRGRDIALELAVRPIAHRMDRRFRLHGKGPLETLVLPFRLAYYRLQTKLDIRLHPEVSDSGLNTSLRSRGEIFSGAVVRSPCHTDCYGSGRASTGLSCGGSRSVLMCEQSRYVASFGEPGYFHDQ